MNDINFSLAIVDDDRILHYVVSTLVRREIPSAVIHSFNNAVDFLKALEAELSFDMVLLDLNMPRMDGWELLDHLKSKDIDLPIYILSSSTDARDLKRVNGYPIVRGYLVKPVTVDMVQGLLSNIIV